MKGALQWPRKAREMGFKRLYRAGSQRHGGGREQGGSIRVKSRAEAIALISGTLTLEPVRINTRELFAAEAANFDF